METADVRSLVRSPRHPYTRALIECLPARAARGVDGRRRVSSIPGAAAGAAFIERGCKFAARCAHARDMCAAQTPALERAEGHAVRCLRWREIGAPPPRSPNCAA